MADFDQLTMEEIPQTSLVTVLSKVSAALNFWSGITVILFVEIFELFYRLCFDDVHNRTMKITRVDVTPRDHDGGGGEKKRHKDVDKTSLF